MTSAPTLITGSNGRLGRALLRVGPGQWPLVGVTSPRAPAAGRALDITDAAATLRAIGEIRPRVIIHLASMVGSACEEDPKRAEAVNVTGTANLVAAAEAHSVERIVFVSTAGVYGDSRRRRMLEQDATAPTSVYATTKLRAEQVLADAAGLVSACVLRVFNIYGPEMQDSLVTRLLTATADAPVRLAGLDGFVRDYVHVDDVARAVLAAADSTAPGFRVLNVGSGVPRSNRDLLGSLASQDRASVTIGPEVDSYSCADITAITRELSWRPIMPWPALPSAPPALGF